MAMVEGIQIIIMTEEILDNILLNEPVLIITIIARLVGRCWDWGWKGCLKRLSGCIASERLPF